MTSPYNPNFPSDLVHKTFEIPSKWQGTGDALVLKPTYGSLGNMYVEFREESVYSGSDSAVAGKEVSRKVEICLIQTDKFSRVPLRVRDPEKKVSGELSPQQEFELAGLYERFKSQKDSTDTNILQWEAANDMEKAHLAQLGIWSVEQLYNMPEAQRFQLGPGWRDLWVRAERHVATKKGDSKEEHQKELELLRAEREKDRERMKDLEEKYFKMQADLADAAKRSTKPVGKPWPIPKQDSPTP